MKTKQKQNKTKKKKNNEKVLIERGISDNDTDIRAVICDFGLAIVEQDQKVSRKAVSLNGIYFFLETTKIIKTNKETTQKRKKKRKKKKKLLVLKVKTTEVETRTSSSLGKILRYDRPYISKSFSFIIQIVSLLFISVKQKNQKKRTFTQVCSP